jgi:hypothetical protein
MAKQSTSSSIPAPDVLPYLRAALEALRVQVHQRSNYFPADNEQARFLLDQLARHGLTITPLVPATGRENTRTLAQQSTPAPAVEPRRIEYTQAESNKLLKAALAKAWPETRFFVRGDAYGNSEVYYLHKQRGPKKAEVVALVKQFKGEEANNCDGRDAIYQPRAGADGFPELVRYRTGLLQVRAIATSGPTTWRQDGLEHITNILPISLKTALLRNK